MVQNSLEPCRMKGPGYLCYKRKMKSDSEIILNNKEGLKLK